MIRVGDAGGKNHPLRFLNYQIDRLNCPCRLFGKHDGEILRVLGLVRDPLAVQIQMATHAAMIVIAIERKPPRNKRRLER